jgi:DNA-binding cell septation regulator SpoVG
MKVEIKKFYPFLLERRNAILLGYADIILDGKLEIRGIKLFKKHNGGIFITPPSVQNDRGEYIDIVEFLDKDLKEKIRKTLSNFYKENFETDI